MQMGPYQKKQVIITLLYQSFENIPPGFPVKVGVKPMFMYVVSTAFFNQNSYH